MKTLALSTDTLSHLEELEKELELKGVQENPSAANDDIYNCLWCSTSCFGNCKGTCEGQCLGRKK